MSVDTISEDEVDGRVSVIIVQVQPRLILKFFKAGYTSKNNFQFVCFSSQQISLVVG